ncbi:MAG: cytochrome c biogenesis protein CcdA [Methanosarcinaceae archaeon]|nr:cytochrome c biogenesis protein CcdA [Methanosarcinaceae archaeon]
MYADTFTLNSLAIFLAGPVSIFIAGVVSVLSPCVFPLLPVILAYSAGQGKFRPLAIVLGLTISFTFMGMIISALGAYIWDFRILAEFLLIAFGLSMLMGYDIFAFSAPYAGRVHVEKKGVLGGLLVGFSLGVAWVPCVGPILGGILTAVGQKGDILYGASQLIIYSMGFAVPMLMIAYFTNLSSGRLSMISKYDTRLKRLAGLVFVLAGLWMVYNNHIVFYM